MIPAADKPLAGQAVHYLLGIGRGVAYGIAAEVRPSITTGYGTVFGLGTATPLDNALVPATGLGEAPWRDGASTHVFFFASHPVFGTTARFLRRQVRATLG